MLCTVIVFCGQNGFIDPEISVGGERSVSGGAGCFFFGNKYLNTRHTIHDFNIEYQYNVWWMDPHTFDLTEKKIKQLCRDNNKKNFKHLGPSRRRRRHWIRVLFSYSFFDRQIIFWFMMMMV